MTARGHLSGHVILWDETENEWIFADTGEPIYTQDMAGHGQFRRCAYCGLGPTPEGHDGCMGTLPEHIVMNACCGHGIDARAYVQHRDGTCVRGAEALEEIEKLRKEAVQ
ncbi:hypothetical protein RSO41_12315 [Halomonas sp. I1]|uniref:hypothetical protein n=1 Tax=Halomonas sp. I1 TaxID=393536 RepID=UPI0028DF6B6D|nr:hypothetical protein [Halomonas sp. I1]MDT8895440.1 hypothetical protein [Halomonas sp. I1]